MLSGARERAAQLGLSNIEFQVINAEWIDLPVASVDVVLCRWGYMLMADPAAALGETRRVLSAGGRVAFAVWDGIAQNPWAALPGIELRERGLVASPERGTPGPFALGDPERVRELIDQAGFSEPRVQALELDRRHASFDEFWETTLDLSRAFHDAVLDRGPMRSSRSGPPFTRASRHMRTAQVYSTSRRARSSPRRAPERPGGRRATGRRRSASLRVK